MKKILILSDDVAYSLLLNKIIEVEGYETLIVTTIQDALSSLKASDIDVIGMVLPLRESEEKVRGWGFYSELKNNDEFGKIPVLVFTPFHRKTQPDPRNYGDALFTTPIEIAGVRNKIREFVGSS